MKRALVMLVLSLALSGCAIETAYADRITVMTEQDMIDRQYARQQQQVVWERQQYYEEAMAPALTIIKVIFLVVLAVAAGWMVLQVAHATGQSALLHARMVPMKNGSYPGLVSRDGRYISNINTGQVISLNAPRNADQRLIAGDDRVRQLQAGAQYARPQLEVYPEENYGDLS